MGLTAKVARPGVRITVQIGGASHDVTDLPHGSALAAGARQEIRVEVDNPPPKSTIEVEHSETRRPSRRAASTRSSRMNTGENKQRIRQQLLVRCNGRVIVDLTVAVSMRASDARAEGIAAHIEELNRYEGLASTLLRDLREATTSLEQALHLLAASPARPARAPVRRGSPHLESRGRGPSPVATPPELLDSPEAAVVAGIFRRLDQACAAASADAGGPNGLAEERAFRTAISAKHGTIVRAGSGTDREVWALRGRLRSARRRAGIRPGLAPAPVAPVGRLRGHPAWPLLLTAARQATLPHTLPPFALISGVDENVDSVYEIWSGLAMANAIATLAGRTLDEVLRLPAPGAGRLVINDAHMLAEANVGGAPAQLWLLPRYPPREFVTSVPPSGLVVKTAETSRRTRGKSQALTPDLVVVHGEGTGRRLHVFDTKNYSGVGATGRVSKALGDLWRRYANYLGMLDQERHQAGLSAIPCVDSVIALHPQNHAILLAPTAMDRDWPAGRPRVFGLPLRPDNQEDRDRLVTVLGTLLGAEP